MRVVSLPYGQGSVFDTQNNLIQIGVVVLMQALPVCICFGVRAIYPGIPLCLSVTVLQMKAMLKEQRFVRCFAFGIMFEIMSLFSSWMIRVLEVGRGVFEIEF